MASSPADASPSSSSMTATPVPFPRPDSAAAAADSPTTTHRTRTSTNASSTAGSRLRSASIKLLETNPPPGMWAATGSVTAKAPTLSDIRRGSFGAGGWNEETQRYRREMKGGVDGERAGIGAGLDAHDEDEEEAEKEKRGGVHKDGTAEALLTASPEQKDGHAGRSRGLPDEISASPSSDDAHQDAITKPGVHVKEKRKRHGKKSDPIQRSYTNGYQPPPKLPWKTSCAIGFRAFIKWVMTPTGFLIFLYGLNVVAWGGMLFLLLCNAAPAMCKPSCNDIQSPRRKWIEIDSQVLNGLFNVTGFGLAPWRFRDLYWWAVWRLGGRKRTTTGIRRLAGIHRGWFRLPGSQQLPRLAAGADVDPSDTSVPIPASMTPDAPPTGHRAPPTKGWKMDFVVWMNISNTFLQVVLCYFMYTYNRYNRPSWATGTFVAMGCIVAGLGGIMMFIEGKAVKKVEGVPMPEGGYPAKTEADVEQGAGGKGEKDSRYGFVFRSL